MARTAQRQRQVETMYAQNLRLRSKLTELCAAVESGDAIKARRLAQSAMAHLERQPPATDAILSLGQALSINAK